MRKLIIPAVLGIAVAGYFFLSEQKEIKTEKKLSQENATTQPFQLTEQVVQTPVQQTKLTAPVKPVAAENEFYAVNRKSSKARTVLEQAGVLPNDLNNEAYIEFDMPTMRALEAGDSFELLIPQTEETFIAEVSHVSVAENGDKSLFGSVTGASGNLHTTVLTIGNNAIYGQLTAPSGNYVFETKDQYGWIAAKRDLYRSHIEEELHPDESATLVTSPDLFNPQPKSNQNQ